MSHTATRLRRAVATGAVVSRCKKGDNHCDLYIDVIPFAILPLSFRSPVLPKLFLRLEEAFHRGRNARPVNCAHPCQILAKPNTVLPDEPAYERVPGCDRRIELLTAGHS